MVGEMVGDTVHELSLAGLPLSSMLALLEATAGEPSERLQRTGAEWPLQTGHLMAPLPRPLSIRDFMAFEAHVRNSRGRRGLEVPPQWYEVPAF